MVSALSKYAFINAKLRARISKILPDEVYGQLIKAASLEATLAVLRDTPFAVLEQIYSSTGDIKQAEFELLKGEIELYQNIKNYIHPSSAGFVDALLYQYEIENLKNAIRIYFDRVVHKRSSNSSVHYLLYEPIVNKIAIDAIVNANNLDEIAAVCDKTPYGQLIRKYTHTIEAEGSIFHLEIALDHFYYENLLNAIEKLSKKDRKILQRLTGVVIDLQNIDWIIRLKNFYDMPLDTVLVTVVPGGYSLNRDTISQLHSSQSVTTTLSGFIKGRYLGLSSLLATETPDSTSRLRLIRRILDEIMKQEVQRIMSGDPFTAGIILCYFILKRAEIKKIRTILNAKKYNIPQERLESIIL
jgi:V/A-type H+/Na+-transporting ATPase subunit C